MNQLETDMQDVLAAPSSTMTWPQLVAAVVVVMVAVFMWRQVTHFIMGEI